MSANVQENKLVLCLSYSLSFACLMLVLCLSYIAPRSSPYQNPSSEPSYFWYKFLSWKWPFTIGNFQIKTPTHRQDNFKIAKSEWSAVSKLSKKLFWNGGEVWVMSPIHFVSSARKPVQERGGGKVTHVKKHRCRSSGTVSQAASLQRRCCFRRLAKRICVLKIGTPCDTWAVS